MFCYLWAVLIFFTLMELIIQFKMHFAAFGSMYITVTVLGSLF